jgi:ATP-dependent DNA helicase RecQ
MDIIKAQHALKQYFGYETFRPMQADIIQAVLDKKDALVLMPTGGGKSICYQIPAIILPGVCVVVSPLIALMKDQVEGLKGNGVEAAFLNSTQSTNEQSKIEQLALSEKIKLLYVSPEKLLSQDFLNLLTQLPLSLFAVDEAHCISSWGHDFRPEYTKLKFFKERFAKVPVIALTATADKLTRKDIVQQLNLDTPEVFVSSFDRPNLSLSVAAGQGKLKKIIDFIEKRANESGIIYCLSRKSTEELSEKLNANGINAAYYHAGMLADLRARVQEEFINDNVPIICATIAFGMGIDKSNVRWVIHYNMPKNLEGYYQEIGRAGRDGLKSDTLLFYSFADVIALRSFAEESGQKDLQLAKLERMQQYADASICRRKILLNYFGEPKEDNCNNCDVCKNPPTLFDGTLIVQKALSAVVRLNEKVPIGMLIDVLRGSSRHELIEQGYQNIKTYGAGKDISYQDWQQYCMQMINMGLLDVAYDESYNLKLTANSKEVLYAAKKIDLLHAATVKANAEKQAEKPLSKTQQLKDDLFEVLRTLRKQLADKQNIPAYQVFSDVTLQEMASEKPTTEDEIMQITGVGERKCQLYGPEFINEIINFIYKQNKQGNSIKGSTYLATLELYQKGFSAEDIARERTLNPVTVYSHLAYLYEKGHSIDLMKYITNEDIQKVEAAVNTIEGAAKLKDIFEYLNETIPYHVIRLSLSYLTQKQV